MPRIRDSTFFDLSHLLIPVSPRSLSFSFLLFFLSYRKQKYKISHLDRFIRAPTCTPEPANSWIGESLMRRGKNYSTARGARLRDENPQQGLECGVRGGDWPLEKEKIGRKRDGGGGRDTEATGGDAAAF